MVAAVAPVSHGGTTVGLRWPRDGRGTLPLGTKTLAGREPGDTAEWPQGRLRHGRACVAIDVGGPGNFSRNAFRDGEGGARRISGMTAGMSLRTRPPGGWVGAEQGTFPFNEEDVAPGRARADCRRDVVADKASGGQGAG